MKLLADENMHAEIVRWLRSAGHDVVWATESLRGVPDTVLLDFANREQRLVLTSDLDFGELIYQQRLAAEGVILTRLDHLPVRERILRLQAVWSVVEANPRGKFIVVAADKIRVRLVPAPPGE